MRDADAPLVVDICRRLDGLPLAIEFAASRIDVLGTTGLAGLIKGQLRLLGARRRGVAPRHRTMRAALDWSYGLLSEDEQQFFRRLGVFPSSFSVEAAAVVALAAPDSGSQAIDHLAELAAKSLVTTDVAAARPRFRLLETIRAYALEKLDESGEREGIARRHAQAVPKVSQGAQAEWEMRSATEWLAAYGARIDNLRVALDWAFSPGGDAPIGVALTAAAAPLWMHLSLLGGQHQQVARIVRDDGRPS